MQEFAVDLGHTCNMMPASLLSIAYNVMDDSFMACETQNNPFLITHKPASLSLNPPFEYDKCSWSILYHNNPYNMIMKNVWLPRGNINIKSFLIHLLVGRYVKIKSFFLVVNYNHGGRKSKCRIGLISP